MTTMRFGSLRRYKTIYNKATLKLNKVQPASALISAQDIELLYLCCKEGWAKSVLDEYQIQKQALSRFCLGVMVLSDPVLQVVRREFRRLSPDVKIEIEQIKEVLAK